MWPLFKPQTMMPHAPLFSIWIINNNMESELIKKKRNIVYLRFSFHQPQQNMRHRAVFSLLLTHLRASLVFFCEARICARAHFYFVAQVRFRSENNFTEMKLLFVCANVSIWMQAIAFLSLGVSVSVSVTLSSVCCYFDGMTSINFTTVSCHSLWNCFALSFLFQWTWTGLFFLLSL